MFRYDPLFLPQARPAVPGYDCHYVRTCNALILEAGRIANSKVGTIRASEDDGESHAKWTHCFSIAMDELAKPLLNGTDESSAASVG